jgi:hypothetical protein
MPGIERPSRSQKHVESLAFARMAGVPVPEDRLDALALAIDQAVFVQDALAAIDYELTEPALRFRPPSPEKQP